MRTIRRILVVAFVVATPLLAAGACSTSPPPASDQAATSVYNLGKFLGAVVVIILCSQPGATCLKFGGDPNSL